MSPRAFGLALMLAVPAAIGLGPAGLAPRPAEASVSVAITLEQLVASSAYVVVGTAVEQQSRWEELGGGRRIVTYTRLAVDRAIAGEPGKEVWVRTLGGVVDKVGQHVSGEAQLALGGESLLFLNRVADGTVVVSAMAQGHYPILKKPAEPVRLGASPDVGAVLPRPGPSISARERLVGRALADAIQEIQRARQVRDGAR